jgi:hypothetical protein
MRRPPNKHSGDQTISWRKTFSTLASYIDDRCIACRLAAACWAATLAGFMALQIYKVLRKPMSMIDDGYFALIARSVAEKLEYGVPISSDATKIFDPEIGAGPALILPAAAAIKLFGAQAWVPAFVVIFLFSRHRHAMIRGRGTGRPAVAEHYTAAQLVPRLPASRGGGVPNAQQESGYATKIVVRVRNQRCCLGCRPLASCQTFNE